MKNSENLNERREFKYLLPQHLVPFVRAAAKSVCRLDGYAGPNGLYTIRSLYFDTRGLSLFWANESETADRFKVRARSYPSAGAAGPVFFEVKQRSLDVVSKARGMVSPSLWQTLLREPGAFLSSEIGRKYRPAVERFITLVNTYHLEPLMLVEYDREAYFSELEEYARLTFDYNIRCQPPQGLTLEADPKAWKQVGHPARLRTPDARTLVELKFAGPPPRWMVDMVTRLELERYSFSKYCYSVSEQFTMPELRVPAWH